MRNSAALPPVEYDQPCKGRLGVITVGPEFMNRICPRTSFPVTLGCAFVGKDECWIVLAEDATIESYGWTTEIVKRHEIGHCNGWPGDHRGARLAPQPNVPAPSETIVQPAVIRWEVIDRASKSDLPRREPRT